MAENPNDVRGFAIYPYGEIPGAQGFKTGALNHSATLPTLAHQPFSARNFKNGREQMWVGSMVLCVPQRS
jgi:hypothetical protein